MTGLVTIVSRRVQWEDIPLFLLAMVVTCVVYLATLPLDAGFLNADVHQQIVSARAMLRGEGFAANIMYYEVQVEQGLGARQTIWPVGYPALLAALSLLTGLDPVSIAQPLSALGHVLAGSLLMALARQAGQPRLLSGCILVGYLLLPTISQNVASGWSEGWFISTWLGAGLLLRKAARRPCKELWVGLGCVAALASFLFRYSGVVVVVAFVGTALLWAFTCKVNRRWSLGAVSVFAAACGAVVAIVLGRNLMLVGAISGVTHPKLAPPDTPPLQQFVWTLERMFGAESFLGLFVLIAGFCGVACLGSRGEPDLQARQKTVTEVSFDYSTMFLFASGALYAALLVGFAGTGAAYRIDGRYMLPLVPVTMAVLLSFGAQVSLKHRLGPRGAGVVRLTLLAIFLWGVVTAHVSSYSWWKNPTRGVAAWRAFQAPGPNGTSVADELRSISAGFPSVLSANYQALGSILDKPTVVLAEPTYTSTTWTAGAVCETAMHVNTRLLIVLDEDLVPDADPGNSPFVRGLVVGESSGVAQRVFARGGVSAFLLRC